jgi:cell wall-associated NlpC family hydrolase
MRRFTISIVATMALGTVFTADSGASGGFSDVPAGYWAKDAINHVAQVNDWMRDFGTEEFRPEEPLTRAQLARGLVLAFAPGDEPDQSIRFNDLPPEDPYFPYANVAVKRGWIGAKGGSFRPAGRVSKIALDRGLVRALRLGQELKGLNGIQTEDGQPLTRPRGFAQLLLGQALRLHFNHATSEEARELLPTTSVTRADGAFALSEAVEADGTWRVTKLEDYRSVVLPVMSAEEREAAEFALAYAGYPYVWAGEWGTATPADYCCGEQVQGGFDCSGFAWWVMRAPDEEWDNTHVRPYEGWPLPERSSRAMAEATTEPIPYEELRPLDLLFFQSEPDRVNHVGLFLGNGWMIHSSSYNDGVSLGRVEEGYYREGFTWGRRLIPETVP